MGQDVNVQAAVATLNKEYERYIRNLQAEWLSRNRVDSRDVYEVMRPHERAEVHNRIAEWGRYITPLAEAWWRERGYGVIWPDENSQPMQVYPLEGVGSC